MWRYQLHKQQTINNRAALITNWASLSHNWHQILYLFLEGYNCHFITEVFGWNWLICYFITSAYKMCIDRICNIIWKLDKYIFNLLLLIYCFWCIPLWIISLLISNQYDVKKMQVLSAMTVDLLNKINSTVRCYERFERFYTYVIPSHGVCARTM